MSTNMSRSPVIVIVGPTGSGKTGVAIEIAKAVGGEVIAADSRTIYKGMDIGTAKPSLEERQGVVHWGFDLVEPGERFTVADWKKYAEERIDKICERGHIPIVVGGTGLYVDALVYDYKFRGRTGEKADRDANIEQKNCSDRTEMDSRFKIFGIMCGREELRNRLTSRANKLFVQDLFDETQELVERYGWNNQAMKSNIYQFAWKYMRGEVELGEAIRLNVYDDWHLARRQMTWFKRNKNIKWLPLDEVKAEVIKCIQNE